MGVEKKVLGLERRERLVLQIVVEQNRAEDGALGFRRGRETAIETEISSRHRRQSKTRFAFPQYCWMVLRTDGDRNGGSCGRRGKRM